LQKMIFMKNFNVLNLFVFSILFFLSCQNKPKEVKIISENSEPKVENSNSKSFDLENSDPKAIAIADEVMKAMGGKDAYDATRYLFWNFFGSRTLLWDKHKGNVRIESQKDDYTVVMNIHSMKGKVKTKGEELSHPDSLSKYLQMGKDIWINDSYWLVMPYKLKDSGVTLKYIGEFATPENMSDILELTFNEVGKTPQNKYWVYVDRKTHLVNKWDFFPTVDSEKPQFSTPWEGYEKFGKILLSGGRGTYQLTDIKVMKEVEKDIFEKL